jgi:two-component system response regulator AtoC
MVKQSSTLIFSSKAMGEVVETAERVAKFDTTVLITGESGTGKEMMARTIHDHSPRGKKPFIAVNCGAIPENLIESELFGHKKGAFTDATRDKPGLFEEANEGTLFLDEIAEVPPHLQAKLLRVLQDQKIRRVGDEEEITVNVRIIAATLRDLEDDVRRQMFRDDLYYRLSVVAIHIPPLRDRPEDIKILVEHFIEKINKRLELKIKGISPQALDLLLHFPWRGNVRELENSIERAMVLTTKEIIDVDFLPDAVKAAGASQKPGARKLKASGTLSLKTHTRELEIELINEALRQTAGNRTKAAKLLEISHRALLYKVKEYGIEKG